MRILLRNRAYRRLFTAQVLALVGTGLATVALGLLAYDLAGGRASEVLGTALGIKMIAYVAVSPLVGALADRVSRRLLMVSADAVRAGVVLLLPFVDQVWQVHVLIAVLQAASAAFTPTFQAVLPDVLPDERDYTSALSASQIAVSMENIASPLLAAALLLIVDFHSLFVGTAIGFVCSAVLVVGAVVPAAPRSDRSRFADRLVVGVRIFTRTPRLRAVMALNMVVATCGVITLVSTVNVVRDLLGGSESDVALLLAVSGAGTAVTALAVSALLRDRGERVVMLAGAGVSVGAVAMAFVLAFWPSWPLAAGAWFAIGCGTALVVVPVGRVVRSSASPADRPAAFAAQFSLSHLCWLLTYPLTGWLGSLAGFTTAWGVLLVLVVAASVAAVRLWPRALPQTIRHGHTEPVDHNHLDAQAVWDGAVWVHTHHIVIDPDHTRWPTPV
ncbi:putative MFS family arabinose efflux permease [Pseudonocardia sediminis]|uniref:Putative MFS family arabinose efflux permease n=1 Tax=Pseudonocardia sediminis TaxID=1397368 RepID=A0A4V2FQP8_PSEST|nr:MFS transporter [Pseudonocardia sediminis]RZT85640.1 putative MFS family arabinose efflux permease [Pseudonocardia sediminis]